MDIAEDASNLLTKLNNNLEHLLYCKIFGFPLVILLLTLIFIYLNIQLFFPSIRFFRRSIEVIRSKPPESATGDITPSQAIMTAALGTIGFGSVAGVAISVTYGGIGAIFWMIIACLIGMSIKFCEISLGVKYRTIDGENIQGGPFYYLRQGLAEVGKKKIGVYFAFIYAICLLFCAFVTGNLFQVNQNAMIFNDTFEFLNSNPHIMAIICTAVVTTTLFAGAKYIAKVGQYVIPPLTVGYILCALLIIFMNINKLGSVIMAIFADAFSNDQALHGGIMGSVVAGTTRAMFCTEFGAGSSSIAHCRAKTDSHVKAGFVGFIELLIVLAVAVLTGLAIAMTGVYQNCNVNGIIMTRNAFLTIHSVFQYIFPFVCFFLAITTVIAWGYYGEMSWNFIFKNRATNVFKILFLLLVYVGSIIGSAEEVIRLTDYAWNILTIPNSIALVFLVGMIKKDLKDYELLYNK